MMFLFAVLNNFIKNLMTTKSRECRSALSREYSTQGRHLLFTNNFFGGYPPNFIYIFIHQNGSKMVTLPKIAFVDRLNERHM